MTETRPILSFDARLAIAEKAVDAAHSRLDIQRKEIREDFGDIKGKLESISNQITSLKEYRSYRKGYQAALLLAVGILGGLGGYAIPLLLRRFLAE